MRWGASTRGMLGRTSLFRAQKTRAPDPGMGGAGGLDEMPSLKAWKGNLPADRDRL